MRRRILLITAILALALPASAAAAPPGPPFGHSGFRWMNHKCVETANGFRTIGGIRTHVNRLAQPRKAHYQEVKIQVDRLAGYGAASNTWRKVDSRTYDWSRFNGRNLRTHSTSGIRTGMQPDTATLSIKATVTLRRVRTGPDKKVWRYVVRSPSFQCTSSFVVSARAAALPESRIRTGRYGFQQGQRTTDGAIFFTVKGTGRNKRITELVYRNRCLTNNGPSPVMRITRDGRFARTYSHSANTVLVSVKGEWVARNRVAGKLIVDETGCRTRLRFSARLGA